MLQRDEGVQGKFSVEIDFTVIGIFMGVSGLSASMETKAFAEGGVNGYEHILPGPIKYGNITLTMGIVNGYELWHWWQGITTAGPTIVMRRNISIVLRQGNSNSLLGGEVQRWNLMWAYPVQWTGPDLSAGTQDVAVQSLELAHQGIFSL